MKSRSDLVLSAAIEYAGGRVDEEIQISHPDCRSLVGGLIGWRTEEQMGAVSAVGSSTSANVTVARGQVETVHAATSPGLWWSPYTFECTS